MSNATWLHLLLSVLYDRKLNMLPISLWRDNLFVFMLFQVSVAQQGIMPELTTHHIQFRIMQITLSAKNALVQLWQISPKIDSHFGA